MEQTTAVILCGGEASRLGGAEKPLRGMLGRPLLAHLAERLRPQVERLVVVANRQPEAYAAYADMVVHDGANKGRGPLAGIAAGLAAAGGEWVLCVPGDAPLLPLDLLQRLHAALQRDAADVAVIHDGNGRQPLCCLLPRRLLPELQDYLDGGGDAPRLWLIRYRVAEADCSDWPRWAWSINTPEEWAAAETELSRWNTPE
jgi:molybdopterin-guanine dinucleotide biosynthesis protein A